MRNIGEGPAKVMKKLTLTNSAQNNTTVLENEFIDQYMVKANGEYVKVYLLLLRHQNESSYPPGHLHNERICVCRRESSLRSRVYGTNSKK